VALAAGEDSAGEVTFRRGEATLVEEVEATLGEEVEATLGEEVGLVEALVEALEAHLLLGRLLVPLASMAPGNFKLNNRIWP
jgi:hypothetical protein